jgi:hypothetical protein
MLLIYSLSVMAFIGLAAGIRGPVDKTGPTSPNALVFRRPSPHDNSEKNLPSRCEKLFDKAWRQYGTPHGAGCEQRVYSAVSLKFDCLSLVSTSSVL